MDDVVVGNLGEMGLRVCKVLDSILASVSGNIFSVDRPHLSNPSIFFHAWCYFNATVPRERHCHGQRGIDQEFVGLLTAVRLRLIMVLGSKQEDM